jgi:hypothetical protein
VPLIGRMIPRLVCSIKGAVCIFNPLGLTSVSDPLCLKKVGGSKIVTCELHLAVLAVSAHEQAKFARLLLNLSITPERL